MPHPNLELVCTSNKTRYFEAVTPLSLVLQEFESVEAAEDVMDREGRYLDLEDGSELVIEFSHNHAPSGGQASQGMDWICGRCQATNFARSALPSLRCSTVSGQMAWRTVVRLYARALCWWASVSRVGVLHVKSTKNVARQPFLSKLYSQTASKSCAETKI